MIIDVEVSNYRRAEAPYDLFSGGVGTCVALGAMYANKGYMVHVSPDEPDFLTLINYFFKDLHRECKDNRQLQLYVIGAQLDGDKKSMIAARYTVLENIAKFGYKDTPKLILWGKKNYWQTLKLVLSFGAADYEEFGPVDTE